MFLVMVSKSLKPIVILLKRLTDCCKEAKEYKRVYSYAVFLIFEQIKRIKYNSASNEFFS